MMPSQQLLQPQRNGTMTVLHEHDVLLGRGSAANLYSGNKRFRELVQENRAVYNSAVRHREKKGIAKQVLASVRSQGGRFMKQVETNKKVKNILTDCDWKEVSDDVALEKCKQALRQQQKDATEGSASKRTASNITSDDENDIGDGELDVKIAAKEYRSVPGASTSQLDSLPSSPLQTFPGAAVYSMYPPSIVASMSLSPPELMAGGNGPSIVDQRLLLLQRLTIGCPAQQGQPQPLRISEQRRPQPLQIPEQRQPQPLRMPQLTRTGSFPLIAASQNVQTTSLHNVNNLTDVAPSTLLDFLEGSTRYSSTSTIPVGSIQASEYHLSLETSAETKQVPSSRRTSPETLDEDVSEFLLLSALEENEQPRLTAQELQAEWANMTDEEKADALCDVFGKMCDYNTQHKNKKAKRDLDPTSIAFLVLQMRYELEKIPDRDKTALVEAQLKARRDEFSDARLVRFLRCDGFNTKLAAQRFVKYWEGRREVFGGRYTLPITLSEALYGDTEAIRAIEAGVFCLLPHLDTSGRQLLFIEPPRHTKIGYSSASLLRAVWYIIEVTARQNNDLESGGVVELVWDKDSSVWDYDNQVYSRWTYFETYAWPLQITCFHVLCPPPFIKRIIFPIMMALTDKRGRARTLVHDVPESDVLQVLAKYGILKHMLPEVVGGDVVLDYASWISERRAAELEEI